MKKSFLYAAGFYISNLCNLKCNNCQSFSNHDFKGHHKFDAELYQNLSSKLNLGEYSIVGGEPTLNPYLPDWIKGIRSFWPDVKATLVSNGIHLVGQKNLHQLLAETNTGLQISLHSERFRPIIAEQLHRVFGVCSFVNFQTYLNTDVVYSLELTTTLGVKITVDNAQEFQQVPQWKDNQLITYNSDREIAHKACLVASCHHIKQGKVYKCPIVTVLEDFLHQQNYKIPQVLTEYQPLAPNDISDDTINGLSKSIPQCTMCPASNKYRPMRTKLRKKSKKNS